MTETQTEKTYEVTKRILTIALSDAQASLQELQAELGQLQDDGWGDTGNADHVMRMATVAEEQIKNLSEILGYDNNASWPLEYSY